MEIRPQTSQKHSSAMFRRPAAIEDPKRIDIGKEFDSRQFSQGRQVDSLNREKEYLQSLLHNYIEKEKKT